ncbi:glycosyltransferase, partial [Arthrospira platensis SPKY1]|nr:glycosyltransferase [Arthrospira platensis SPKY1]
MNRFIDILVPVYRGLAETRRCLESILKHPQQQPYELIVIDDAGPEPALTAYLDELVAARRITLLRHTV